MRAIFLGTFGLVALAAVACGGDPGTGGGGSTSLTGSGGAPSTSTSATGGGAPASLDTFTESVAGSICGALHRCCDAESAAAYFAPWAQSQLLAAFVDQIPPKHAFADEAECAATVKQMLDITPFGDWVAQAKAGRVDFDAAAFTACRAALDGAACGKDVGAALADGTCFGFGAPSGGSFQRRSFHRTGKAGDVCAPIRDGVGAAFFGTCDPTASFCCYADPQAPGGCALPFGQGGAPRAGTCKAASKVGEACAVLGSVQVCVTGASCDSATDHCVADGDAPLAVGDTCADASFNLLGVCQQSWCDILGTGKCEPPKADGSMCSGGDECASTACVMGACGAPTFCKGT